MTHSEVRNNAQAFWTVNRNEYSSAGQKLLHILRPAVGEIQHLDIRIRIEYGQLRVIGERSGKRLSFGVILIKAFQVVIQCIQTRCREHA